MISLLKRNSLDVTGTFTAEKFALNLTERQSTATITIGPEAPEISVGDWLRDNDEPGAGIVWRVKSIDTDYATDTRTLNCEHMIQYLRGRIMFGEVTPKTITGDKTATKCTAAQAVTYILKQQSVWKLKKCEISQSEAYSFNGDDLYSALETVSSSLENEEWRYDFSSYPFQLTVAKQSTDWGAEMRMDRNIRTLKKTVDMSRMYTRFYPIGKNNLRLSGNTKYVAKNDSTYGAICKVETNNELDTEAKLKSWAKGRLKHHAEPVVTVTISGMDMSAATGLSIDKLAIGKKCRVPLPEFGTTITERITKLSWADKKADPESVTVTLANEYEDVASIINNLQKSVSSGSKGAAKSAGEDHAWITDTTEKVELVAEAVGGKDDKTGGPNWSRVSKLTVDGKGIAATVTETAEGLVTAQSQIKQNATSISATVKAVGANGKITAASIVAAVNKAGSSVTISADHVVLKGTNTTLDSMFTMVSGNLTAKKNIYMDWGNTKSKIYTSGGIEYVGASGSQGVRSYLLNYATIGSMAKTIVKDGDKLKIELFNGSTINFSGATSLSGEWSGSGKLTVTASPQGETYKRTLIAKPESGGKIPIYAQWGASGQYEEDTGFKVSVPSYTSKTLRCTSKEATYPGSTTYYYYFRLEGNYSFSVNTNYTMYRTSW